MTKPSPEALEKARWLSPCELFGIQITTSSTAAVPFCVGILCPGCTRAEKIARALEEYAQERVRASRDRRYPCLMKGCDDDAKGNYPVCYSHRQELLTGQSRLARAEDRVKELERLLEETRR